MVQTLVRLALRHYRDPTSWAGVVSGVLIAAHVSTDPAIAGSIDTILAAVVSIALVLMDGRSNPNTDSTGAISVRPAQPAATAVQPGAGHNLQDVDRPDVRPANQDPKPEPVRPGFGPY